MNNKTWKHHLALVQCTSDEPGTGTPPIGAEYDHIRRWSDVACSKLKHVIEQDLQEMHRHKGSRDEGFLLQESLSISLRKLEDVMHLLTDLKNQNLH